MTRAILSVAPWEADLVDCTAMDAAWLKDQLSQPGRSQSACARFIGVDASAVNRMTKGDRRILAEEADKIRAYLLATGGKSSPTSRGVDLNQIRPSSLIPVVGTIEAGSWKESDTTVPGLSHIPVVADQMFDGDVFALKVVGPSVNELYADGSYVIVRKWAGGPLPYGKIVAVQRTRPDGLYEYTLKELRDGGGEPQLWPRSRDPRYQEPISFGDAEGVTVQLVGRVIAALNFTD